MRKSAKMKKVITRILKVHGVTVENVGDHAQIDREPYMRLVIEKIAPNQISVAHYFEEHGDLIADPEIVFFIAQDGEWYPIEMTTVFGYKRLAYLSEDGTEIHSVHHYAQRDVAIFANKWARNLFLQGFNKKPVAA